MVYTRCIVADKSGHNLAELSVDLEYVAWRIGKVAKAKFNISPLDPKATRTNLRFGNRILFQFENGLPNWVGVLDPPREWKSGNIKVTAYSAEHILEYRQTGKSKYFAGVQAGKIYKELIQDMNNIENTGIDIGNVWVGGAGLSVELHFESLLYFFQDYLTSGLWSSEFDITGAEEAGQIVMSANFYERKGADRTGIALLEGANIESAILVEEGPIVNSWDVAGQGTDWGDTRLTARAQSNLSISEFGLREGSAIYPNETLQTTLEDRAANSLLDTLVPYNAYELEALDEDPGEFRDYDLGDYVKLVLRSYGFGGTETTVRIRAREYRPDDEICTLIVQET
jgi:hypothetical protein